MRLFVVQVYLDGQADGPPIREIEATTALVAATRVCGGKLSEKGPLRLLRADVWPQDNPKQRSRFYIGD
jgi:hypothetical protein